MNSEYRMSKKLRVLAVDDHPMFRSAIVSILEEMPYVTDIKEANNGVECLEILKKDLYDVVLLDINMPEKDGIETFKDIRAKWPKLTTIILTQYSDSKFSRTLLSLGVNGYLLKSTTEDEFTSSFEAIVFNHERVTSNDLEEYEIPGIDENEPVLGKREIEVLALICQQYSSKEIADMLHVSLNTVNNHRKAIMKKTNSITIAGMVKWALENNISV